MNFKKLNDFISNQTKPVAFICGGGLAGLGSVRCLGRNHIPVVYLDHEQRHMTYASKFCFGLHCPNPLDDEKKFLNFLTSLGSRLRTEVVLLPIRDPYVVAVSKYKEELEQFFTVPLSRYDVVEKIVRKKSFYSLLETMNLDHPKTYVPNTIASIEEISEIVTYPCILKPSFSFPFSENFGQKVIEVTRKEALIEEYRATSNAGYEMVIQEIIPGDDTNLFQVLGYLNERSEPLGLFSLQKMRQHPAKYGSGTAAISRWKPDLAQLSVDVLRNIGYHGMFGVEFKWDSRDEKYKFIEINARAELQIGLAARCNVDLTTIQYWDAMGMTAPELTSQKEGIKWLYFRNDLLSSFHSIFGGNLSFSEWIQSLKGEKEYAVYALDDLRPFYYYLFDNGIHLPQNMLKACQMVFKK